MAAVLPTTMLDDVRYYEHAPSGADTSTRSFLLVHGLGTSLDFWNATAPALSAATRTVAFDVPGFGESARPDGHFDLRSVAEKAERFLDRLAVSDAVIVGHSLGGILALRIAADRPDLVSRIVLVDGMLLSVERVMTDLKAALGSPGLVAVTALQFVEGLVPMSSAVARLLGTSAFLRKVAFSAYLSDPAALDTAVLLDAISHVGGRQAINVLRVLRAAGDVGLEEIMKQTTQPSHLVWGSDDPLITESDIQDSRKYLKVLSEFEIDRCGHWPMVERPAVLNAHLLETVLPS